MEEFGGGAPKAAEETKEGEGPFSTEKGSRPTTEPGRL